MWQLEGKEICILVKFTYDLFFCAWYSLIVTNRKVAGSFPDGVTAFFHWHNPYGPGVDSASDRNEYQEYFLGIKAAGA
jgi:hypothetical protein